MQTRSSSLFIQLRLQKKRNTVPGYSRLWHILAWIHVVQTSLDEKRVKSWYKCVFAPVCKVHRKNRTARFSKRETLFLVANPLGRLHLEIPEDGATDFAKSMKVVKMNAKIEKFA